MNLKGKRRTLFLLLAVLVLVGGFWLWQGVSAPLSQYQNPIAFPSAKPNNFPRAGEHNCLREGYGRAHGRGPL